jgi:predicted RNA-binding protein (virulence factor B family)
MQAPLFQCNGEYVTDVTDTSETVNIAVKKETHGRLEKLGVKGESFDNIIVNLLRETEYINNIEALTNDAERDFEVSKADFKRSFPELIKALKNFIETVKAR